MTRRRSEEQDHIDVNPRFCRVCRLADHRLRIQREQQQWAAPQTEMEREA